MSIIVSFVPAALFAQPFLRPSIERGSGTDEYILRWHGSSASSYFIQSSLDLETWIYLPTIELGLGNEIVWSFEVDRSGASSGIWIYDPSLEAWIYKIGAGRDRFFINLIDAEQTAIDPDKADFDGDGVGNLDEILLSLDPLVAVDLDGDGLWDDWEIFYGLDSFDNMIVGSLDLDGDTLSNTEESSIGSNPNDNGSYDLDFLPDDWERLYGLDTDPNTDSANFDFDSDGLTDEVEFERGLNPAQAPQAQIAWSDYSTGRGMMKLALDGSHSSDPDGVLIVNYSWDFGSDGVVDTLGQTVNLDRVSRGDSSVTLTITSQEGATGSIQIPINDGDLDGVTDEQEIENGTDALDYYNGIAPILSKKGPVLRVGVIGTFFTSPLILNVRDGSGFSLVNAPVLFSVSSGDIELFTSKHAGEVGQTFITLLSDEGGNFLPSSSTIYLKAGDALGAGSVVASALASSVTYKTETNQFDTPEAPSDLSILLQGDGTYLITWTDNATNEEDYILHYYMDDGRWLEVVLPLDSTSYVFDPMNP